MTPQRRLAMWAAVGTALTLGLVACGGSAPTQTPDAMFHAYIQSTTVTNDQDRGATSADRLAEFAAEGTPNDIISALFSAHPCDGTSGAKDNFAKLPACPPNASVAAAATRFTGSGGTIYARDILIQHQGGQLELMPLYLATSAKGGTELIDTGGQTYAGGLTDFSEHNALFTADDQILAPGDITATSGSFKLVVVSGHAGGSSPWLIVGIAVVIVVGAGGLTLALIRSRRRRTDIAEPDDDSHLATP
jgi:hypothetical protein